MCWCAEPQKPQGQAGRSLEADLLAAGGCRQQGRGRPAGAAASRALGAAAQSVRGEPSHPGSGCGRFLRGVGVLVRLTGSERSPRAGLPEGGVAGSRGRLGAWDGATREVATGRGTRALETEKIGFYFPDPKQYASHF